MRYGLDKWPGVGAVEVTCTIKRNFLPLAEQQTDNFWHFLSNVWGRLSKKERKHKTLQKLPLRRNKHGINNQTIKMLIMTIFTKNK